jgi:hypothetical protein
MKQHAASVRHDTMTELPESLPALKDPPQPSQPRTETTRSLPTKRAQEMRYSAPPSGWLSWWPVAAGVVLGVLAGPLRSLLTPYEPWGMRLVFPLVLVSGLRETGFSDEFTRTMPQLMLILQFPLEGLLARVMLRRGVRVFSAVGQLVFLHALCALVLWLVAGAAQ